MPSRPKVPPRSLVGLPNKPAILGPVVANLFGELRVNAALHVAATARTYEEWFPIRSETGLLGFEILYEKDQQRWRYNARCQTEVRRTRKAVLGEHAGFCDFWVPVGDVAGSWGTLAVGPFAKARPTSGDVLSRFRWLSGRHGRLGDSSFAHYLATTLATLTLEGSLVDDFRSLLASYARLFEDRADLVRIAREIESLSPKLLDARFAERMWEEARAMIDERTARVNAASTDHLHKLGIGRLPEHVVAGLAVARHDESDPVDAFIRRDAFQRACVQLMRRLGNVACGRIGDHGVALLVAEAGVGTRARTRLIELGERAVALAKRFGLRLHLGVASSGSPAPLWLQHQAAVAAAEQALSLGLTMVHAGSVRAAGGSSLANLRRQLGQVIAENPNLLLPRFQGYAEAAQLHCGFRIEPMQAHLEAGFDQIADALLAAGALDDPSVAELRASIERDAEKAQTTGDLAAAYRRGISDVELALRSPGQARQDRSLRRAVAFIREHLSEPLGLAKVAKVAGFSLRHFTELFARREKTTLQAYVTHLRLERAQSMLMSTALSAERVGQLSGFGSRVHFHRAFKRELGMTPLQYRRRQMRDRV